MLGLGGGRGRGGETEQRAEASRGGQRRPKLMGGHCGNHVVKYTCKSYSRNGGRGEGERVETEGRENGHKWQRERERGGQREKQGLSQVVHSGKRVFDKHTESKQSQSTVTVTGQFRIQVHVCSHVK